MGIGGTSLWPVAKKPRQSRSPHPVFLRLERNSRCSVNHCRLVIKRIRSRFPGPALPSSLPPSVSWPPLSISCALPTSVAHDPETPTVRSPSSRQRREGSKPGIAGGPPQATPGSGRQTAPRGPKRCRASHVFPRDPRRPQHLRRIIARKRTRPAPHASFSIHSPRPKAGTGTHFLRFLLHPSTFLQEVNSRMIIAIAL